MKNKRIHNDIFWTWTITRDGEAEDLTGALVSLFDCRGRRCEVEYAIDGNVVSGVFRGKVQRERGVYTMVLTENAGADGMTEIDEAKVWCLVDHTWQEGGEDEEGVSTTDVNIESDIAEARNGVGIDRIVTTRSTEDEGVNVVTIVLDNGIRHSFEVMNGSKGEKGDAGHTPVITTSKSGGVLSLYADDVLLGEVSDGEDGQDADIDGCNTAIANANTAAAAAVAAAGTANAAAEAATSAADAANTAAASADKATAAAEKQTDLAQDATFNANTATDEAYIAATEAKKRAAAADTAAANADEKAAAAEEAAASANAAAETAATSATNANNAAHSARDYADAANKAAEIASAAATEAASAANAANAASDSANTAADAANKAGVNADNAASAANAAATDATSKAAGVQTAIDNANAAASTATGAASSANAAANAAIEAAESVDEAKTNANNAATAAGVAATTARNSASQANSAAGAANTAAVNATAAAETANSSSSACEAATKEIARQIEVCKAVTAEASNVDAELDTDTKTITITNRNGESKSVAIPDDNAVRSIYLNDYADGTPIDLSTPYQLYVNIDDEYVVSEGSRRRANGNFVIDCFSYDTTEGNTGVYSILEYNKKGYVLKGYYINGFLADPSLTKVVETINDYNANWWLDTIHTLYGINTATTSVNGLMSATDKSKLDGIAEGAEKNPTDYVKDTDARLSDARTPLAHTHAISEVTNLQSSLDALSEADSQISNNLQGKFDTPDSKTIEGFGITDAYTKTEIDTMIGNVETLLANI